MIPEDLKFSYPPDLVASSPRKKFKALAISDKNPHLLKDKKDLFDLFFPGDTLIINNTKVIKRRVLSLCGREVLFIKAKPLKRWEVLFPCSDLKIGDEIKLPENVFLKLLKKDRPQEVELSKDLKERYFETHAKMALPPYIEKKRGGKGGEDHIWYQSPWAKKKGSVASPTASLHFDKKDLKELKKRGVLVGEITLHVGLGTFLPLSFEQVKDKKLHKEWIEIPFQTLKKIEKTKKEGLRVWALGTTVTRALESFSRGELQKKEGSYEGFTDLLIFPPYKFQMVDVLMTNFHQPQSSLLALLFAFSNRKLVLQIYKYAMKKGFRLFSYGDLTVWF